MEKRRSRKKTPAAVQEARDQAVRAAVKMGTAEGAPVLLKLAEDGREFELHRDHTVYERIEVRYVRRVRVKDLATLAAVARGAEREVVNMQRQRERAIGIENRIALLRQQREHQDGLPCPRSSALNADASVTAPTSTTP